MAGWFSSTGQVAVIGSHMCGNQLVNWEQPRRCYSEQVCYHRELALLDMRPKQKVTSLNTHGVDLPNCVWISISSANAFRSSKTLRAPPTFKPSSFPRSGSTRLCLDRPWHEPTGLCLYADLFDSIVRGSLRERKISSLSAPEPRMA